jgi:hypothetical protein
MTSLHAYPGFCPQVVTLVEMGGARPNLEVSIQGGKSGFSGKLEFLISGPEIPPTPTDPRWRVSIHSGMLTLCITV